MKCGIININKTINTKKENLMKMATFTFLYKNEFSFIGTEESVVCGIQIDERRIAFTGASLPSRERELKLKSRSRSKISIHCRSLRGSAS